MKLKSAWALLGLMAGGGALWIGGFSWLTSGGPGDESTDKRFPKAVHGSFAKTELSRSSFLATAGVSPAAEDDVARMLSGLRRWQLEPDPRKRARIQLYLKSLLTDENAGALLRLIPAYFEGTPFAQTAFDLWAAQNPSDALHWLAGTASASERQIQRATQYWLQGDTGTMGVYLESLPPGNWKDRVTNAASSCALLKERPEDAVTWLMQIDAKARDFGQLEAAAMAWGKKDAAGAISWIATISDPDLRNRMVADVAIGYAAHDPEEALLFASDNVKTDSAWGRAVSGIFSAWAENNPSGAAEGLALVEGGTREQAAQVILREWAAYDLSGLRKWVLARPPGSERDRLLVQLDSIAAQGDL